MKNESTLNKFDFFGVHFELRMHNYQKYRTRTGAMAFIIYFIFCTICALALLIRFIRRPNYSTVNYEEPTNSQQIKWTNENFHLAIKLPTFYDEDDNMIDNSEMFHIQAIQRSRNSSRILEKTGKETKIPINTRRCNITDIFTGEIAQEYLTDYENMDIICFDLNETHFIKNSQFTNHSYVKIEIWVNKTYFSHYVRSVKKQMERDPFYLNLIFPVNIISDDYTKSNQFLNGIFLYLNEKEKTIADVYLKKNIYQLDDNVLFNNPVDYHYNDYYAHDSYNIIDDFFYKFNFSAIGNSTKSTEEQEAFEEEDPKIAKIIIRNHVMSSIYVKTRQKLLPFLQNVNSIYINVFLTVKALIIFINLQKAKIDILDKLFEISFGDLSEDHKELIENENYRKIKLDLNQKINNIRNSKLNPSIKKNANNENLKDLSEDIILKLNGDKINTANTNNINIQDKKFDLKGQNINVSELNKDQNFYNSNNQRKEGNRINNHNSSDRGELFFDSKNPKNNKISYNFQNIYKNSFPKENGHYDKTFIKFNCKSSTGVQEIGNNNEISDEHIDIQKSSLFELRVSNPREIVENRNMELAKFTSKEINKIKIEELKNKEENENLDHEKLLLTELSIKNLLQNLFCCKFSKIKSHLKYYSKAERLFDAYFDIRNFIKKMKEIEALKNISLNDNQKFIFEFLSYPSHNREQTLENYQAFYPFQFIKNEKDVILKAYESLYQENISKLKSERLLKLFENHINN